MRHGGTWKSDWRDYFTGFRAATIGSPKQAVTVTVWATEIDTMLYLLEV